MVTVTNLFGFTSSNIPESQSTLSLPAGSWTIFAGPDNTSSVLDSNLPVRVVQASFCGPGVALPVCLGTPTPYDPAVIMGPPPVMTPSSLVFGWPLGAATLPAARTISVNANGPVTETAQTTSGGSWLSASNQVGPSRSFSVSVDPSKLGVGTYQGSIVVTPAYGPSAALPVSLTVTSAAIPMISATLPNLSFSAITFTSTPYT